MREYCYEKKCYYWYIPPNTWISVLARDAVAMAAKQAMTIGADYTLSSYYVQPLPASETRPVQRGIFRCDSFVVYSLSFSTRYTQGYISRYEYDLQSKWLSDYSKISTFPYYPATVFERIKSTQ